MFWLAFVFACCEVLKQPSLRSYINLAFVEGAQVRTTARGNLFSFELPWDDVMKRCQEADTNW